MDTSTTLDRSTTTQIRACGLAGVGAAVLTIAGDLVIGPFPDEKTSPADIAAFYRDHHAGVRAGGTVLVVSVVLTAFFFAALWSRVRATSPVLASVVAIGAAADVASLAFSAETYRSLGAIGTDSALTPQALQAWHVWGATFGAAAGGIAVYLAVFVASVLGRALPVWLGVTGLVLGVAALSPFGFLASMLGLIWTAAAGIAIAARPTPPAQTSAGQRPRAAAQPV
jgi:hypothetical protein